MSGGSHNYLCRQWPLNIHDLGIMAERLESLRYFELCKLTESYIPKDPPQYLRKIWEAVEWYDSCDISEEQMHERIQEATNELHRNR